MNFWIELKFCGELLFEHMEDLDKYKIIWISLASTYFIKLLSG
jgi:hypothetical protein